MKTNIFIFGKVILTIVVQFIFCEFAQSQVENKLNASSLTNHADSSLVINQLGYGVNWSKLAYRTFHLNKPALDQLTDFASLIEISSQRVVMKINISSINKDLQTKDWIQVIDFSDFRQPGRYILQVGELKTEIFTINEDIYTEATTALLRSFYLQRCGRALNDSYSGVHHEICHTTDGKLAHDDEINVQNTIINTEGGWHDAGDYGKYISTTAVSIGRILNAFERAPSKLNGDNLGIPESKNGIPDILDEMRIGLDWMVKMQRSDGAVYRKIGGAQWPHNLTPDQDKVQRNIYGVSSTDTAKAAAAWALAARIYKLKLPMQSKIYLESARKAWQWLETAELNRFDYKDGDDGGSGPYRKNETDTEPALTYDWDDKLWAATEFYISTGEEKWIEYINKYLPDAPLNIFEWKDPSAMAMAYFVWHPALKKYDNLARTVRPKFLLRARNLVKTITESGYRVANKKFIWGSNKMTLEEGMILCHAYEINHNPDFLAAARDQLHYIFGRNYFGKSFVSGIGSNPVKNVNHLFGTAANLKIPGLLVGGPNEHEQSNIAPKNMGLRSWIDDARSYATNEYAIDYNASLIGLISALNNDCYVINK